MKSLVTLLLILCIFILSSKGDIIRRINKLPSVDPIASRNGKSPTWNKIRQRLDHFNPQDLREWDMRYLSNDQFFQDGGPLMLFVGGEWAIDPDYLQTGQIYDIAEEHGGYMFYTEHRYYGESIPTRDTKVSNLIYLNAEQAMADLVYFIYYIKSNIDGLQHSKVVAIGGSYAGTLAAWLRAKYPHVVDISYSSSAPMRAVADYKGYFEVVRDVFEEASPLCSAILMNSTTELDDMLKSESGISAASEMLNTCDRIKTSEPDISYLYTTVIGEAFASIVQNNGLRGVKNACDSIVNSDGTAFERVAAYIRVIYNESCIGAYSAFIDSYSNTDNAESLYRNWVYQTCTEFGFFQSTTWPFMPTPDDSYSINMCSDIFGPGFDINVLERGLARTNMFYGGKHLKTSRAIFAYGMVDPWHKLGILKGLNPSTLAVVINETTHCGDLISISSSDSDDVASAKTRIQRKIAKWLNS